MRAIRITQVICVLALTLTIAGAVNSQTLASAHDLAPKVADFVVANGKASAFNKGRLDEITRYSIRFYTDRDIYEVSVSVYKADERRGLSVAHYITNQHFQDFLTPADIVAHQLIWGRPMIYFETHLYDDRSTGDLSSYQQFTKKSDSAYEGFTREERDRGKKAGVREFMFFKAGKVLDGEKWKQPVRGQIDRLQEEYASYLIAIAKELKISLTN